MKSRIILFIFLLISGNLLSQAPQGIPYQAAARNANGQLLANRAVQVRFSILDSTTSGLEVYKETHNTSTNALGLFTLNVGMGTVASGIFSSINWGQNFKFLKVELDTTASGSNFVDLGTQQMMSVPYALYSGKSMVSNNPNNIQGFERLFSLSGNSTYNPIAIVPQGKKWKIDHSYNVTPYLNVGMGVYGSWWANSGDTLFSAQFPNYFCAIEEYGNTEFLIKSLIVGDNNQGQLICVPNGKYWRLVSYSSKFLVNANGISTPFLQSLGSQSALIDYPAKEVNFAEGTCLGFPLSTYGYFCVLEYNQ